MLQQLTANSFAACTTTPAAVNHFPYFRRFPDQLKAFPARGPVHFQRLSDMPGNNARLLSQTRHASMINSLAMSAYSPFDGYAEPPIEDAGPKRMSGTFLTDEQYRGFIENLPVLFYAVDPSPPYSPIYVSPAFSRFGYPLDDWTKEPEMWLRVIHPEDREWVFAKTTDSTATGKEVDYEYRILHRNGSVHWVRDRGCLIRSKTGNVVCREGIILDITEQKQAEEQLRLGEERFRNIFENATDIIYVHDLDGNYLSINDAGLKVFGYTREEALNLNLKQVTVPEHFARAKAQLEAKVAGRAKQTSYEVDCFCKNGSRITLEVNTSVIRKDGKPIAVQGIARDVTERKHVEAAVRESEERYRDLFENANDLIYTHDLSGNFTSINRAGEIITGYSRDEAVKMNIASVVAPEFLEQARRMTALKVEGKGPTAYELEIVAKGGRRVSLELSTRLICQDGKPVAVQGIGRDISERKRTEEALKASETRYRQLGEGILHQIWTARSDGHVDYVNKRMVEYFNRASEQLLGDRWYESIHPDDLDEALKRWGHSVKTGEPFETEFRLRRRDGLYRWHVAKATPGHDVHGKITKWFGTNTDIHEQKESEEKLNYYARHCPLTDLPNRVDFMSHLNLAIQRAEENPDAKFAVLFLDLDRFKVINDSLGHVVGDKLLIAIAGRLKTCLRPGDVVARLGGDEFTILLNRTGGEAEVSKVVERVQAKISEPFTIDNYEVFTTASVGIILSDHVKRAPEDYLRDADAAMYRAKEAGKARYEIFDREMHVQNLNLLQVETDLRHAVEREEFELLYQPIVDIHNGEVSEFEALIRWQHPSLGQISPDSFVGVAEETGLIIPIGKWVLEQACRQIAEWQRSHDRKLSISVNLSAKQLMHPSLTGTIEEILVETGLDPKQLKLEVTESTVMEHSERSMAVLKELDQIGILLSTDDFGTGYSSLSYLQRFPFDRMKIDRSFVDKLGSDKKSDAIVKTILMLGNNLGLEVVAEGIETAEQLELLQTLGCRLGQGYLFSRPVTAEVASKVLLERQIETTFDPSLRVAADEQIYEFASIQ
jgi:diguanylate cyclase (GGDEF)-like protein/PAS domain S-box-containing protein